MDKRGKNRDGGGDRAEENAPMLPSAVSTEEVSEHIADEMQTAMPGTDETATAHEQTSENNHDVQNREIDETTQLPDASDKQPDESATMADDDVAHSGEGPQLESAETAAVRAKFPPSFDKTWEKDTMPGNKKVGIERIYIKTGTVSYTHLRAHET